VGKYLNEVSEMIELLKSSGPFFTMCDRSPIWLKMIDTDMCLWDLMSLCERSHDGTISLSSVALGIAIQRKILTFFGRECTVSEQQVMDALKRDIPEFNESQSVLVFDKAKQSFEFSYDMWESKMIGQLRSAIRNLSSQKPRDFDDVMKKYGNVVEWKEDVTCQLRNELGVLLSRLGDKRLTPARKMEVMIEVEKGFSGWRASAGQNMVLSELTRKSLVLYKLEKNNTDSLSLGDPEKFDFTGLQLDADLYWAIARLVRDRVNGEVFSPGPISEEYNQVVDGFILAIERGQKAGTVIRAFTQLGRKIDRAETRRFLIVLKFANFVYYVLEALIDNGFPSDAQYAQWKRDIYDF